MMQESILLDDAQEEFHFVETKRRGWDWTRVLLSLILVSGCVIGGIGLYQQTHAPPASEGGVGLLGSPEISYGWQCKIHMGNNDEADCNAVAMGTNADLGCPNGFAFHSVLKAAPQKHVDAKKVEDTCRSLWDDTSNGCHFDIMATVWTDITPAPVDEPVDEEEPVDPETLELEKRRGLKVHYFCKVAENPELVLSKPLSCNTCQIIPDVSDYCLCKTCRTDSGDDIKITCPADKPTMRILAVKTGHHSDGNNIALVYNNCKENWETLEGASPSCTINLDELMGVDEEEDTEDPPLSRPPFGPPNGGPPRRPPFPQIDWDFHDSVEIKYFCEV